MKRAKHALAILAVISLACLSAAAQTGRPYRLTEQQIKNLLDRIEKGADRFRGSLKDALSDSRFDDTRSEDRINDFVKEFESATDRLEERFDDDRSATGAVEEVLRRAASIDSFMIRHSLSSRAQTDWASLRSNLDELARAYNVAWSWAGLTNRPYRISDAQLKNLLERIEKGADRFRDSLKDALSRSRFDDTRAEDDINQFVKDFEEASDRLEGRFDSKRSAASDAEEVLRRAARIDDFMTRNRLTPRALDDWMRLRTDLDQLATAYDVSWRW
jgi:DNA repair exonuclease SbcCD ATPase subunit